MKRVKFRVEADRSRQLVIVSINGVVQGFHMTPNAAGALGRRLTEASEYLLIDRSASGARFVDESPPLDPDS